MMLVKKWNSTSITSADLSGSRTLHNKVKDLPLRVGGRLFYLAGVLVEMAIDTVSFTTEPGIVGNNNAIKRVRFGGGSVQRMNISGNGCRMFERLERGKAVTMESINTVTTHGRYWSRYFPIGPPGFAKFTDFGLATCIAQDHDFEIDLGSTADVSVDLTAFTGAVNVYAVYYLKDELVLPCFYERREDTAASGDNLLGESLIGVLGLCNSTTFDAITAADFGDITLETGYFSPVDGAEAEVITRWHNQLHASGELGGIQGEPRDGTYDVMQRQISRVAPTALLAQTADLQPVLVPMPGQKITKLPAIVTSGAKLRWSGANGNGTVRLIGRFLKQTPSAFEDLVKRAADSGVRVVGPPRVPTISKRPYNGPLVTPAGGYMPVAYKIAA